MSTTSRFEEPLRILITGASGGLGEALALHYAAPGRDLVLWGRNETLLTKVAESCRQAGAWATTRSLDLTSVPAAIVALKSDDGNRPIDLAILTAGSGDIRAPDDLAESPEQVARLGLVNFVAPCAMAAALARTMSARRSGHIVFIGSAAAFHALPFAPAYAGSKAGLARFADALRIDVAKQGVSVTLVSPGFIDTAAGRKFEGARPMLMSPSIAARRIGKAIEHRKAHVVFPWPFALLRLFDRLLPRFLRDRLLVSLSPHAD